LAKALTTPSEDAHWDLALRPLRYVVEGNRPYEYIQSWARPLLIEALSHMMRFEEASNTASRFLLEPGPFNEEKWTIFIVQLRALRELGRAEEALAAIERLQTQILGLLSAQVTTEMGLLRIGQVMRMDHCSYPALLPQELTSYERARRHVVTCFKAELLTDLGRMDEAREVDQDLKRFNHRVQVQSLIREAERLAAEGLALDAEEILRRAMECICRERDDDFRFPKVWLPVPGNLLLTGWVCHRGSRHG
jgi:tetratricopeptide (TPR) repeat protein